MKKKIFTTISTLMILIPWTILPLRSFPWALKSPVAEIMISGYAAFMIFSGIFTILAYTKAHIQHTWMKICVVINGIYMAGGIAAFLMMLPGRI
ncbi:MAG: hypothetical protein HFH10_00930 [Dorea sp.]|nr:hypothetical protein [Dorea sp.]